MKLLQKIWDRLRQQTPEPAGRQPVPSEDRSSMAKLVHLFQQDDPPRSQPK